MTLALERGLLTPL